MLSAEKIINLFDMKPLPNEGGYYTETYRAAEKLPPACLPLNFDEERNLSTTILYLITAKNPSQLHRLKSDEVYHYYLGSPVTMLLLHPDGGSEIITLGQNLLKGQNVQVTVPRNTWQGCLIKEAGGFALMGCTVAPGFEPADFEAAERDELLRKYDGDHELIEKLTPNSKPD